MGPSHCSNTSHDRSLFPPFRNKYSGGWKGGVRSKVERNKEKEEEEREEWEELLWWFRRREGGGEERWIRMCVVGEWIELPLSFSRFWKKPVQIQNVFSCCSAFGALGCVNSVPWNFVCGFLLRVCVYVCAFFSSLFTSASRFVNNLIFMTCSCAFSLRIYRVIIFFVGDHLSAVFLSPVPPSIHLKRWVHIFFLLVLVASALESDEHDFVIIDNIFIRCSRMQSVIVIASHDLLDYR